MNRIDLTGGVFAAVAPRQGRRYTCPAVRSCPEEEGGWAAVRWGGPIVSSWSPLPWVTSGVLPDGPLAGPVGRDRGDAL